MNIQLDRHTVERAEERGTTEEDILDTLATGTAFPGKRGRMGKAKVFPFNAHRGDRFYPEKRVEVIYLVENDMIVTVTVYVFFGKWE